MGSANINDRSQKVSSPGFYFALPDLAFQGDGDSEICLVVEDDDMLDSTMDGEPFQVARFATTLRRKLFRGMSLRSYSTARLSLLF